MRALLHFCGCVAMSVLFLFGCGSPHGQPRRDSEILAPNEIFEFGALYSENCAGCHGEDGRGGAALALANPVYLAIADEKLMRKVVGEGVKGVAMPAFAQSSGGMLTDKQIDLIVGQIRARWSQQGIANAIDAPSYTAKFSGDVGRGETAYKMHCESCHGADGRGGRKGSAITNDSFLALISDQGLRTVVIVGRPELGMPDWRGNDPGKVMSEQEVTDLVAWIAAHRLKNSGQAYSKLN